VLEKTWFQKKTSPVGFFLTSPVVFLGFLGVFWVFWVIFYIFALKRVFLGFFQFQKYFKVHPDVKL
jgi:hypothetical protein